MCILQVSTLADHAHVGTCTSAVDLVHELCHSLANTDSELEPSVRHFSALVSQKVLFMQELNKLLQRQSQLLLDLYKLHLDKVI